MRRFTLLKGRKTPAKLVSDECIPELINIFLEKNSIKIISVIDLNLTSQPDEVIFKKARSLKLPIITLDVKFVGQIYEKLPSQYGCILLRYKGQRINEELLKSIWQFIANEDITKLKNAVVVIDEQKYRKTKVPRFVQIQPTKY